MCTFLNQNSKVLFSFIFSYHRCLSARTPVPLKVGRVIFLSFHFHSLLLLFENPRILPLSRLRELLSAYLFRCILIAAIVVVVVVVVLETCAVKWVKEEKESGVRQVLLASRHRWQGNPAESHRQCQLAWLYGCSCWANEQAKLLLCCTKELPSSSLDSAD